MKTVIRNGFIVDCDLDQEQSMDILIVDGRVVEISPNITIDCDQIIDAMGNYILPGLVDMNCNICEPGFEYREEIISVSNAAAKGGFTTLTYNPNTNPVIDNKTVVQYIITKCHKDSKVNIFLYGSMSKDCMGLEIAEIGEMKQFGIVAISDAEKTIMDNVLLRNIFKYSKMFDIPVITHCEDKALAGTGVINEGLMSTQLGLCPIPREAEEVIVARNLVITSNVRNKLHISNITTHGSVELIRFFKEKGIDVTCATSPHYFTLTEEAIDSFDTLTKVNPPLRTPEDLNGIICGLQDGVIDVIATSHLPSSYESKKLEFDLAATGISSLETAFAITYTNLVLTKKLSLLDVANKMSTTPCKILGLANKGRVKIGYDADLIIVDIKNKFKIDASKFLSKAKYSPYDKMEVYGAVTHTLVKGILVYGS